MSDDEDIPEFDDDLVLDLDAMDDNNDADEGETEEVEYVAAAGTIRKCIVVEKSKRLTSNILQRPEMTEAIGIRAAQIAAGSRAFTDIEFLDDPIAIAEKELMDRKSPLILRRIVYKTATEDHVEEWKVRKMSFPAQ